MKYTVFYVNAYVKFMACTSCMLVYSNVFVCVCVSLHLSQIECVCAPIILLCAFCMIDQHQIVIQLIIQGRRVRACV